MDDGENEESTNGLLTFEEARVLGCLIEKEITTPEYYPLTLNALVAACNQRSNRDPVVEWDAATVQRAVDGLRRRRLAVMLSQAGARGPKYKHTFGEVYGGVDRGMIAVLCELLLRNAQTPGELRARTERLHPFPDLAAVEEAAGRLIHYGVEPLVALLPPGSGGRRAKAYAHLLCGPVTESASGGASSSGGREGTVIPPPPEPEPGWRERVERLETELAALRAEVAELRSVIEPLR